MIMEHSYAQGVIKTYFQSYRLQNLETKDIHQSTCDNGVLWAWLLLGECLLSPAHKIGYLIGAISLLLWIGGCFLAYTQIISGGCQWSLLLVTFAVNVVSFAGAVLSLQIMLLISYDMVTSVITVLIMLVATMEACVRHCWGRQKYQTICKTRTIKNIPVHTQQSSLEMAAHKVCAVPLSLGITSLLTVVYVTVTGHLGFIENTPIDDSRIQGLKHQTLLTIVGFAIGCLACLGRLWIGFIIISRFLKAIQANRVWKGGGVMLMLSDILYIIGVLLQSGSFRVTIVTLPWLIGRAIQCCLQICVSLTEFDCLCHLIWQTQTLTPSTLLMLCPCEKEENNNKQSDEERRHEVEAVTLIENAESEESDTHVLFDRALCDTRKSKVTTSSLQESHTLTGADDVTTTSDSELSSANQEHELIWEDVFTPLRIQAPIDLTATSQLRLQRLSLASQIETLTRTTSETNDQRVRSWISQSTPEEETPSSVTLTLNLDTTHESTFNLSGENFANRKLNTFSSCPLGPRKNSF